MSKLSNLDFISKKFEDLCNLGNQHNIDSVIFMLDDKNFDKCIDVYRSFKSKFSLLPIVCNMICDTSSYKTKYSSNHVKQYIDECKKMINMQENICIEFIDGRKMNKDYFYVKNNFIFKNWLCDAGKDFLFIDVDGNIYPCQNCQDKNVGSIYKKDAISF